MRRIPRIATDGRGISSTIASSSDASVGVPQPSFPIGPIRYRPICGGNTRCRSEMIRGALATMSFGKRMLSSVPSWTPARSASRETVWLAASRPPTPFNVNPKPSWIGWNSAVMRISSE